MAEYITEVKATFTVVTNKRVLQREVFAETMMDAMEILSEYVNETTERIWGG